MLAAVACNHTGDITFAVTNKIVPSTLLVGECQAAILALSEAASRKYQFCIIEGDSQIVISNLNDESSSWEITNSVAAVKALCHQFMAVSFTHVSRVCNFYAHNLAKWALSCNVCGDIVPLMSLILFFVTLQPGILMFLET